MRKVIALFLTFLAIPALASPASADTYPSRPVRIVVPASAGGGSDIAARVIADKLRGVLDTSVIVENRPGGGGRIGTEYVAHAAPDGYTLLLADISHVAGPALHKVAYDPIKDFAPVSEVTRQAYVLVVQPSLPTASLKDFIARAKAANPKVTFASTGIGAPAYLAMEEFKAAASIDVVHVPYEGGGPAMNAMLAKTTDAFFASVPAAAPYLSSGQMRALAVTSLTRSAVLPDVPSIAESGYPGFELQGWKGVLAPTGTPPGTIARLHDALVTVLSAPDFKAFLAKDGSEAVGSTPDAFLEYLKSEQVKWEKVLKQPGVKPD